MTKEEEKIHWWFIARSTPVIIDGKATFRMNDTGEIVDFDERKQYYENNLN